MSMEKLSPKDLSRSLGLRTVPKLGLGGASLGDLYQKISNEQALSTVNAAYENGVRYFDSAPWYGVGLSEARMGLALHDKPRDSFIFQTKVGRYLVPSGNFNPQDLGWSGGHRNKPKFVYTGKAFKEQHADSL